MRPLCLAHSGVCLGGGVEIDCHCMYIYVLFPFHLGCALRDSDGYQQRLEEELREKARRQGGTATMMASVNKKRLQDLFDDLKVRWQPLCLVRIRHL